MNRLTEGMAPSIPSVIDMIWISMRLAAVCDVIQWQHHTVAAMNSMLISRLVCT